LRGAAETLAQNIIHEHFGFEGEKDIKFAKVQLEKLWPYYDVLNEGFIDV